jgi:hypothetical protein
MFRGVNMKFSSNQKYIRVSSAALGLSLMLSLGAPAFAQDAAPADDTAAEDDTIVVTGFGASLNRRICYRRRHWQAA